MTSLSSRNQSLAIPVKNEEAIFALLNSTGFFFFAPNFQVRNWGFLKFIIIKYSQQI